MAPKKKAASTANQRESRVSTPASKPSGGYSGIPLQSAQNKPSSGSSGGLSAKDRAELLKDFNKAQKMLADITKDRDTLVDQYKRGLGGGFDDTGGSMGSGQQAPMEDAGLAYSKMQDEKAKRNAFALLKDVFTQYGLSELGATLETLMKEGYEPEEATLALKTDVRYNAPYIARFRGNELRRSAGLNVLSEAEYLTLEDDYTKTLKSYGLENYFGATRTLKQTAIADVIGADISAIEFTDRVSTAVDRVKMADPATKSAFQQFYGIGEADLVQYFLDPKKALVNLKEKATAAEIGGAAIGQGLAATMTSAEDLARFGINRQQAQAGYADIGQDLPTAGSLGRIYSESGVTYNQADAESATFKGLASAKRKKEQLKQLEEGQFSGKSGTALGESALSTQYLRRSSSSGQF
jgi:hypothetical protein